MSGFKAIILAGGNGERFWPLSTPTRPKQFLRIFGSETLLRQSVTRLRGVVAPADVYVVTAAGLVAETRRELPEVPATNIIGEPLRRDTAAAVALGVAAASADDPEATLGFFPADQLVTRPASFRKAVRQAIRQAEKQGEIVTLGIRPTGPAVRFGYVDPVRRRFVEKPGTRKAARYVRQGYLWNAGMFIARAPVFRAAIRTFAPALTPVLALRSRRQFTVKALMRTYERLPRISFDFAVMEKIDNLGVVPGDFGWDDVGGYRAFEQHFTKDKSGSVTRGEVYSIESTGCTAVAEGVPISLLGVKDIVVVTTPEAVLVVSKDRLDDMKKLFSK